MSNFSTVRPADFDPSDAEIFYKYSPTRYEQSTIFRQLDPAQFLIQNNEVFDGGLPDDSQLPFPGLYTLRLPQDRFNESGVYTIYIRPREIRTTLLDCGFLSNNDVKGLVLNGDAEELQDIEDFNGYRIEYYEDGRKINNVFRIVTSSNRCEPISEATNTSSSQKQVRYRLTNEGSLFFLTVSPSVSVIDNIENQPFIGFAGQEVRISNTFFNPITLEIELVDNDLETIAAALYGNQLKDVSTGKYGIYDSEGNLIKGFTLAEVKEEGTKRFEVRAVDDNLTEQDLNFNEIRDRIE